MFLFLLTACMPAADDSPTAVFDDVWTEFDIRYGGFRQRDIDWDDVYDTWSPHVNDDMSDDELFEVLGGMMATLDDGHVRLLAPGREVYESSHVYRDDTVKDTFDIDVVEANYFAGKAEHGPWDWYSYGVVGGDVPYLWLPGIDDNTWVIDDIADEHPDAPAFIIDLRHSHGGAFTFALHGMGRLTAKDVPVFRSRSRNGPDHDDFDDWMTWDMPARGKHWDVPLIVLTDAETISASERMLLALLELPDVTTIGTLTNGALATSIPREAPNRWTYQLSVQEVKSVHGEVHEGVGIPADIELLNDPEDVATGKDEVLEAAIDLAHAR